MWQTINDALNQITSNPVVVTALQAFLGGLLVSVGAIALKLTKNLSKGEKQLLVYLGGVLVSGVAYIMSTPSNSSLVIFVQGAVLFVTSQMWWRVLVKRLMQGISDKIAEAVSVDDQVKSALQPVANTEEEAPVEAPPIEPDVHSFTA